MGGDFFKGGGVTLISSLCEGGEVEINFCLMRGEPSMSSQPTTPHFPGNYCTAPKKRTLHKEQYS